MLFAGIIIESLMIDKLKKKWMARFLFLLVFVISVCSTLWPMGDPDLSKIETWMQNITSNTAASAASNLVLPIITLGNIIYFLFIFTILFLYVLISILYSRIYVGEKGGQGTAQSVLTFIKRLPLLIAFYLILLIPSALVVGVFSPIFAFVVPALYFAPLLITYEKNNPIKAIISSYKYTKGAKFSVFWNILMLLIMYWLAESIFLGFLTNTSNAGILLQSFLVAYFVLACGRLNGAYFNRLRQTSDTSNNTSSKD